MSKSKFLSLSVGLSLICVSALAAEGEEGDPRPGLETSAYMGVSTRPVPEAMGKHLELPPYTGLLIYHLDPDSASAGVLEVDDILLKLDDQILINREQLSALVRSHAPGDELTLAVVHKGEKKNVSLTLGAKDLPPLRRSTMPSFRPFQRGTRPQGRGHGVPDNIRFGQTTTNSSGVEVHTIHIGGDDNPIPMRIQVGGPSAAGSDGGTTFGVSKSYMRSSGRTSYTDREHVLTLQKTEVGETLTAKDSVGMVIFEGPVNTPEELAKVPADVRRKLEKMRPTPPQDD